MGSILTKEWVDVSKVLQHFCSYQSEGSNGDSSS